MPAKESRLAEKPVPEVEKGFIGTCDPQPLEGGVLDAVAERPVPSSNPTLAPHGQFQQKPCGRKDLHGFDMGNPDGATRLWPSSQSARFAPVIP
jgi:hypothetical protein